jgi:hypothetical protein
MLRSFDAIRTFSQDAGAPTVAARLQVGQKKGRP